MKVLMAEDIESAREQLMDQIGEVENLEVRFVCQDVMSLFQTASAWRPDVAILDIRMRGMIALGVLETLKMIWPEMAVVVAAFNMDTHYRATFLRQGADCVFDKSLEWSKLTAFLKGYRGGAKVAMEAEMPPTEDLLK